MTRRMLAALPLSRSMVGALLMAGLVRGYLLWQYYCISSDGVRYIRAATDFYAGHISAGLQSLYPPGYPLLIAAIKPIFGNWELAGQCLSIICGIALLLPLYSILQYLFNPQVAVVACYLAALNPYLALYSVHVRSESTYLLLTMVAFYLCLVALETRSMARFFWVGLVAGFAFLVRPEAIGFLAIVPAVLALRWLVWREQSGAKLVASIAALSLGFVILALPYVVYLSIDTGRIGAISRKAGITLAINLHESGLLEETGAGQDAAVESFVFTDYVLQNPVVYLTKVISDLLPASWTFVQALYYSYLPFLLVGLLVALRPQFFNRSHLLLTGFVLFYAFGFALFYVKRRYALQAVPLSLAWVALGVNFVWQQLCDRLTLKKARLSAACVGLLFLAATLPKTLKPVSREKAFVREAGWYLKERNHDGMLSVAAFDERMAFYAAARSIVLQPPLDATKISLQLREQHADYFAAEAKSFAKFLPEVSLRPEQYGLVLEQSFVGTRKDRMLIFKVS